MKLPIIIGRAEDGSEYVADLAQMQHLLIAGATTQGKSHIIHGIIQSLTAIQKTPTPILLLFDPKGCELTKYDYETGDMPIPGAKPVVSATRANKVLSYVIQELESRQESLSEEGDICLNDGRWADIVVIIDEFADLVMYGGGATLRQNARSIRNHIHRLAAEGHKVGIHLVLSTQRVSPDVIDSTLRKLIPSRIAVRTINAADSRLILRKSGAEKLQRGEMLLCIREELVKLNIILNFTTIVR